MDVAQAPSEATSTKTPLRTTPPGLDGLYFSYIYVDKDEQT